MNYSTLAVIILLLSGFINCANSQQKTEKLIACLNKEIGLDDYLNSGQNYIPTAKGIAGSPFFKKMDWKAGLIYMPHGTYPVDKMKLDLNQDQLILSQTLRNNTRANFIIPNENIDSFQLAEYLLINSKHLSFEVNHDFLEKISYENIGLYKSSDAIFLDQFNRKNPKGKFINANPQYWIDINNQIHKFSSTKDLTKVFKDHKKAIKKYFSENDLSLKEANVNQLKGLLKFLHGL